MESIQSRIQHLLDLLKVGPSLFADNLGVQRSSISHLISGRNRPGMEFFEKLSQAYPNINLEWLITGNGSPWKPEQDSYTHQPMVEKFEEPFTYLKPDLSAKPEPETIPEPKTLSKKLVRVVLCFEDGGFETYAIK